MSMLPHEKLLPLLVCLQCGSGNLTYEGGKLQCPACSALWSTEDGRILFAESPANAPESIQRPDPRTWSAWRKANYEFFSSELPKDYSARVLDIGAGPTQFRDLFHKYALYLGIDFYPYEEVQVVADITQPLPIADESFDVVILSNVLEHTPDVSALLREVQRCLVPGGVCLATSPFLMRIHQAPYDFNRLTRYQLERIFMDSGFATVRVQPLGRPADVLRTMHRHFFEALLATFRTNRNLPLLVLARIARMASTVCMLIAWPLYTQAAPSDRYTEGYGTVAHKP